MANLTTDERVQADVTLADTAALLIEAEACLEEDDPSELLLKVLGIVELSSALAAVLRASAARRLVQNDFGASEYGDLDTATVCNLGRRS